MRLRLYKLSYRDAMVDHWAVVLAKDEKEARDLLRSWFPSNIPQFALTVEEVYPIDEARVIYASKPEQR